MVNNLITLLL